jgi:hypothetical protein
MNASDFFGCAGSHAAFGDILLTAAGRLDHLIVGTAAATDPAVAEFDGTIVNYLRHLVRFQGPDSPWASMKPFGLCICPPLLQHAKAKCYALAAN